MTEKSKTGEIADRLKSLPGGQVRIDQVMSCLDDAGYPALLLTLALLCIATPIPKFPPFNLIFALPFLYFGWQMFRDSTQPCLPDFLKKKTISRNRVRSSAEKINHILGKAEKFSRPSLPSVVNFKYINQAIGAGVIIMTMSILLPLPFTSSIPSFFIALTALGRLYDDGRLIIAGLTGGTLWVYFLFSTIGEVVDDIFEVFYE